jgi:hypothetical protein
MFNVNSYINDLKVDPKDEELSQAKDMVTLTALICDDAWLCRQAYYGMAGAMDRQLEYLGGTLLPNAEQRLNRLEGNGILSEGDVTVDWFSNEDKPHINEDRPIDQLVDDQKAFIDGLVVRMRTAAIIFVTHCRAHDDISKDLEQLSYNGIRAKASSNREARAKTG